MQHQAFKVRKWVADGDSEGRAFFRVSGRAQFVEQD